MIENTQPARLYFGNIITSYTGALMQHSPSYDGDVVGRSFWLTKNSITQDPIVVSGAGTTQQEINGLVPGTSYTIEGTYYDAMVSMAMLTSRIGVSVSIPTSLITKTLPTISNVTETFKDNYSEIGLRNSKILISIEGDAETFYVEYNSGSGWLSLPPSELSSIETDLPPNNYSFRVSGATPTGLGVRELSTASLYSEVVTIEGTVIQPNTPTNLIYSLGKIQDTFERYDLKLEWSWARGNGGNIREFLVKAIISEDGGSAPISSDPRWDTPLILTSVGSSTEIVLTGIPKGIKLFYRIEATGYDSTRGISDILTLTAGDDTVDSTYTKESGIEVNYAHILAYATDGVDRVQTFKVEASTGEVSIGKLDPTTGAPIRVDPNNGRVTVKGDVVTDTINAASFVMTQFSSSDRPSIRTAERSNYADGISGLYMGYNADTNNPAFQFDIGNISNYMRWDGNSLSVKGSINATSLTVGGTIPTEIDNSNAISAAAQDATEKAEAAEASASYGYGTYSGNYPISSDGEGYLFKFKPVDFANIEDMVVVVDQIDLEANVFLTVNGTEITPIGGTNDTREWNKFEIDSSYLNSSSDNFVHVGHKAGSSADFGVLFSISLLKNTETIKGSIDKANQAKQDAKDYSDDTFVTSVFYGQDIASIQDQIDGSITNWFYPGEPSVSNIPSSGWPTDSEKDTHLGDIYYDEDTGYAYRFQLLTSVYSWKRIADEGIAAALAVASTAQDTADQKRRVFVITPVIPYDVGDLWDVPGLGIRRCSTPKTLTGSYSISDWDLIVDNAGKAVAEGNRAVEQASTDATTKANQAISRSANNLINTAGWYTGRGLPFGELEEFNPGNSSNWIDYQVGPFGNRIPVLTQYTTDNQDPSGGWSGGIQFEINGINYNNKAAYRVSCWILRNTNEPSFYMGYGSSDVWDLGTINNNTNPYSFPNKLPPSANKWYLLVAVVHGSNYEDATDSGQTGWYDPVTGLMVGSEGNEYRARSDSSSLFFRISQYRTKIGCVTEFYQPLVQKLDGSETPIGSLLVDPSLILNTANQAVTERIYPQTKLQISGGNYQNDTNSGWGIHKDGHAVFNDVLVRGHVEMLSGHISSRLSLGATSGANWSFIDGSSSVYAAYFGNGTSWIKKNGDCKFGSGTFEGTVLADRIDADVVAAATKNISARSGYGTYLLMSGTVGASKSAVSRKLFIPAFQIELYASATHYDSNGSTSASVSVRIQCSYNYRNWYTSGFHEISVYDRGGNTDRKSLVGVIGACVLTFNNGSSGSYFVRAILRRSGVYADVKLSEQKTVVSLFRAGSSLS